MKAFLTVAVGLSFVFGPAVYAQTGGGTTDKAKVTQKTPAKVEKAQAKGGDDGGGKATTEKKKVENKKKDSESWDWGNKKKAETPKAK
jgi:hypothetical protein